MKKYKIKEIFGPTIQGEGTFSGNVVMFVRFSGCNKWSGLEKHRASSACPFCDTDFVGGKLYNVQEIISSLKEKSDCRKLVLSGGEPTLQIDYTLLSYLVNAGYELHLETNGSKKLGQLRQFFKHVTLSPKQKMQDTKLEWANDLKLLYPPINDEMSIEDWKTYHAENRYLQPVWGDKTKENTEATIKKVTDNPELKLSLQLHKIIKVP